MGKLNSCLNLKLPLTCFTIILLSVVFFVTPAFTFTASAGRPYQGRLINGVPFPNQFPGYYLRDQERAYATPEAIATVLDAIDAVRERYPDTCDLFIGDFSREGGGWLNMHRSHQNGRDVDLGMYAKGNRALDTFVPMNEETLDAAKTWCFMESLLRSQHIQYIFLDRRIQRQLHEYALSQGVDPGYLDQLFANGRNSPLQHVGGHYDHMHVRFYTPWSTKAARLGEGDDQQQAEIEMAQQAYLPQKVNYYVKQSDRGLAELAQSFGVNQKDLCRWNQINPDDALEPGACLVFYKRSFEVEPVHLARSLQPDSVADSPGLHFAAAGGGRYPVYPVNYARARMGRSFMPVAATYTVNRGDTLAAVAQRKGVDINTLCAINGLKPNAGIKPGQKIKLTSGRNASSGGAGVGGLNIQKPVQTTSASDSKASKDYVPAVYTAERQDTLQKIAKQQGVDLDALCKINGLSRNSALKPGQKIRLCDQATAGKAAAASPSPVQTASRPSAKKTAPPPSTLQKNMKAVPSSNAKAVTTQQKVQGAAQKSVPQPSTVKNSVQLTKTEKAPAKKR